MEFRVNLLTLAAGERFVAVGRVLRPGRTLPVCAAEAHAEENGGSKLIAAMQATMIAADSPGRRAIWQAGATSRL